MDLDNKEQMLALDSQGIFKTTFEWPVLIKEIISSKDPEIPNNVEIGDYNISYRSIINQVLILGMGGSAIAGDYLKTVIEAGYDLTININRGYNIPQYVDKHTLVIVSSYSGNTEETLSSLKHSIKNEAQVFCVTSGGKILEYFIKNKLPYIKIPAALQPRASFPLQLFAFFKILGILNLIDLNDIPVEATINKLNIAREKWHLESLQKENLAKQVAHKIKGKIPIFWSQYECISRRGKCQLNENSKTLAFSESIPELCHNHVVGWQTVEGKDTYILLTLRFSTEHKNNSLRFNILKEKIKEHAEIIEVEFQGGILPGLIEATLFIDYVSIYLAMLQDIDPNPVNIIEYLKNELNEKEKTQDKIWNSLLELNK